VIVPLRERGGTSFRPLEVVPLVREGNARATGFPATTKGQSGMARGPRLVDPGLTLAEA
jgi:hypothetical protein